MLVDESHSKYDCGQNMQVMHDVVLHSAEPLTCSKPLARFVSIDASSTAAASNEAVETSPHLHTLSDPDFSGSMGSALEHIHSAIQSASAHCASLSTLRSMLQGLSQLHKAGIEQRYTENLQNGTAVDELRSLLRELSSNRGEVKNVQVCQTLCPVQCCLRC